MKNVEMFLASSFEDVSSLFEHMYKDEIKNKSLTFIPTASNTESYIDYMLNARQAFVNMGLEVYDCDVSKLEFDQIKKMLEDNDFIYVSGGNTFYLLQELEKSKAAQVIIQEINKGKLYIGESAGSMIVSPDIEYVSIMDDPKIAKDLKSTKALNLIDFYPIPHYNEYPYVEAANQTIEEFGKDLALKIINNHQVIYIKGDEVSILG